MRDQFTRCAPLVPARLRLVLGMPTLPLDSRRQAPINLMRPTHLQLLLLIGTAILSLNGCSTTQFTSTWKAPNASLAHIEPGSKVGAMVMHPDVSVRRAAEDALTAELTRRGLQGITGYSILGDTNPRDEGAARAAFTKAGAAAVVVMRGIEEKTQLEYQPPAYNSLPTYPGFWGGYYGVGWDNVYDPGYLRRSKIVTVETLIYDLKSNTLVWAGRSRTVDPSKLGAFIQEIVDEAVKAMQKDGVIE